MFGGQTKNQKQNRKENQKKLTSKKNKRTSHASRKQPSKISLKNSKTTLHKRNQKHGVWDVYGMVYSPRKQTYVRLGSPESLHAITKQLERNDQWENHVKYLIQRKGPFATKLKQKLQK